MYSRPRTTSKRALSLVPDENAGRVTTSRRLRSPRRMARAPRPPSSAGRAPNHLPDSARTTTVLAGAPEAPQAAPSPPTANQLRPILRPRRHASPRSGIPQNSNCLARITLAMTCAGRDARAACVASGPSPCYASLRFGDRFSKYLLISSSSKASGSKGPPHSSSSPCSGCFGSWMASRNR
jgi:hypothetical protein